MGPAGQGLDAAQAAALEVDLRLVVELQQLLLQRLAQGDLEGPAFLGLAVQLLAEEAELAASVALGLVHGEIGVVQQGFHVLAVVRELADADAGRGREGRPGDLAGRRQLLLDALDGLGRLPGVAVGEDHDELVAGQPADDVGGAQLAAQALGDDAQQGIAGRMAEGVVDLLEAVQVEEQDVQRRAAAPGPGDRLAGLDQQQAAVGQAGEGVVEGHLANPVVAFLALQGQQAAALSLGFLALGLGADVGGDLHDALQLPVGAENGDIGRLQPEAPAVGAGVGVAAVCGAALAQPGPEAVEAVEAVQVGRLGRAELLVPAASNGLLAVAEELPVLAVGAQDAAVRGELGDRHGTLEGGEQFRLLAGRWGGRRRLLLHSSLQSRHRSAGVFPSTDALQDAPRRREPESWSVWFELPTGPLRTAEPVPGNPGRLGASTRG